MAPIKFEDDFNEKLDKRTIAPSSGAWEKLSERLDSEDIQKNNKGLWWLGIAASIMGVLLVMSHFFTNETEYLNPEIVNTPDTKELMDSDAVRRVNEEVSKITVASETTKIEGDIVSESVGVNQEKNHAKRDVIASKRIAQEQNNLVIKEDTDLIEIKNKVELNYETEKAQEVADAIHVLSETESGVSNTSIDSLLKQAQHEILLNRIKNEDKVLVDAALLLQEVEYELDQSFREKVFKALKNSYGSVKTAIAERND